MSLNGTSTLLNGKIVHSKARGNALIKLLSSEYGNEEVNAGKIEEGKKKMYGKK